MRRLLLLLNAVLALVPHRKPSPRCTNSVIARTATDPSPPAAGAAPAKRPSRDRRLALAVEALETGARDDRDAVSAKVDALRSKAKGQMRAKLDGLRRRLDALGAPAAAGAAAPPPARCGCRSAPSALRAPGGAAPPRRPRTSTTRRCAAGRTAPSTRAAPSRTTRRRRWATTRWATTRRPRSARARAAPPPPPPACCWSWSRRLS